jgi:hypothetical protein
MRPDKDETKGERIEGTLEERPDDAHPGTKVGGFKGDQTSATDGQTPPPPPDDPGNLPEPPR